MPFEIKYSHETLLKETNINQADLPQSIQEAIESFNAVKETLPKKSNEVRSALTKELKLQSKEIADTITEWEKDPSRFSAPTEPAPANPGSSTDALGSPPSPSMEQGGATPPMPAASEPLPAPVPPVAAPKKKSGSFLKVALWGLFGILAITVGPEMVNSTKEWLKQRKK